jgi:sugar (pentulose or hexulose) kinase
MDTLLGIDLGTTGIKAALSSTEGDLLAESYLEYPLIKPAPGVVEQDARDWWELTQEVIRQALRAADADGAESWSRETVRALGVSSQGISFVPVDKDGHPLGNAINWLDTRATAEAESIRHRYSDAELFRLTGKRASPAYVLPKLIWLRNHHPDLFRRTHKFLMAHDYVLSRLSGQFITDHSMAGGTLMYDITRLDWAPELIDDFEIDIAQLPAIKWSGTSMGVINPETARSLGLSESVMLVVGGQDQKCAALGAKIRPGVATVSLGTASAISCLVDRPLLDPERRIPTFPFVVPGYWDLEGVVGTAGGAVRWLRETLFSGETYTSMDGLAADSPPGAHGVRFYPHLSGAGSPHWRADVWAAFIGLTLAAGPGDIVRSVLEGVAFQIRANLEVMEEMGIAIDKLILFGGGAQSPLWAQMISDITGKPATTTDMVDVANWGACILAGMGAGLIRGDVLSRSFGKGHEPYLEPRPNIVERYHEIYRQYRAQEDKLLL